MNARKDELKNIMLGIIKDCESGSPTINNRDNLLLEVASILSRCERGQVGSVSMFSRPTLDPEDELLALEAFWDLVLERIITPGCDISNKDLPSFRRHSEDRTGPNPPQ